jgi:16S rRNA (guanine527-N7)-methyltransferase
MSVVQSKQPEAMTFIAPPQDASGVQAALRAGDLQMADLEAFRGLLAEGNEKMNLVGPSAMAQFWPRHVYDSAQLLALKPQARVWADLGAGAGFPGLVLAILLKGRGGAHVHLVESMAKRCRFLSQVVQTLGLPAQVHNTRAEDLGIRVDIVTARACAPLVRLLGYAEPYLKSGATGLFLKGQDVVAELTDAAKCWKFEAELSASVSHPDGRVLQVKGLSRVRV